MKYLLLLFVVAFASCEKKQCYQCTEIWNNGYGTIKVSYTNHCDWRKVDAVDYAQRNTTQHSNVSNRVTCSIK